MMGPAFGNEIGLSVNQVSAFMSVSVLGAMVMAWPAGHISDRFDRRVILVASSLIAGAAAFGTSLLPGDGSIAFYMLVALFMGLTATLYPFSVAIMNDRLHSHQIVSASAGLLLSHGLGTALGPMGGSLVMNTVGPGGLFLFMGGISVLLGGFVLYRMLITDRVKPEEQEGFVVMGGATTPYIAELDPRNDEFHQG